MIESKSYELRGLISKDMFVMSKILAKIGIKEFKGCFENEAIKQLISGDKEKDDKKVDIKEIGVSVFLDAVQIVIGNVASCEDEVYTLLSGLSGISKEEISELPMPTFAEMIIDVVKKDEFKDFIKVVSKLL